MSQAVQRALCGEAAQEAFGARLAAVCEAPLLVHLEGDLGAGKTTLVRGFLRALGHRGAVKSPTYTLIEPYETVRGPVYHLDLYRLSDPAELEYLGLREMLAERAILLIEWPRRGHGWLPAADLEIGLEHAGAGRRVSLIAHSPRGTAILSRLDADLE